MNTATAKAAPAQFSVDLSRGFEGWLAEQNASLALTTSQVGKLIFFGLDGAGKFWSYNRNIGRCLGLGIGHAAATGRGRFENFRLRREPCRSRHAASGIARRPRS